MSTDNKQANKSSNRTKMPFIIGLILVAIVVLANLIMYNIPIQIDLTKSQVYSLSNVTMELLRDLEEPLHATIYISEDIPAALSGTTIKRNIQDLMDDFKTYGRANFDYTFIEIGSGEEDDVKRNEAKKLGIEPVNVEIPERIKKTTAQIIAGINLTYENYQESMQINLWDPSRMEYELIKRIEKMIVKKPLTEILERVDKPIQITAYITTNYQTEEIREKVNEIINDFVSANEDKINYKETIVKTDREYNEAVRKNITFNTSIDFSTMRSTVIGYGIAFEYSGKSKSIPNVTDLVENEALFKREIEDNIISVLPKENRIGIVMKEYDFGQMWSLMNNQFLQQIRMSFPENQIQQFIGQVVQEAGKFENPSLQYFQQFSEEFYDIGFVNLDDIENEVDKYQALVVVSTNATYSDWELFHLDRFIMSGKPVAFLVNSVGPDYLKYMPLGQQRTPFPSNGKKRTHNLYDFVKNYGVEVKENVIRGSQGFNTGDGYRYPLWLAINEYDTTPATKKFNLVTHMGWANSVETTDTLSEDVKATPFLKTTKSAALLSKNGDAYPIDILNYIDKDRVKPSEENEGQYTIGYLLEGEFTSYFKGKSVPEKEEDKEEQESDNAEADKNNESSEEEKPHEKYSVIEKSQHPTKLAVIGDRDFISDWMAQFIGYGIVNNIALMQNTIDWMIGEDTFIPVRGKSVRPTQLDREVVETLHGSIMWGNTIGIPLIIIIIGMIVWMVRSKKREALYKRFNNPIEKVEDTE